MDGKKSLKHREKGDSTQPQKVGKKAAEDLISKGAKEITKEWDKSSNNKEIDIIKELFTMNKINNITNNCEIKGKIFICGVTGRSKITDNEST